VRPPIEAPAIHPNVQTGAYASRRVPACLAREWRREPQQSGSRMSPLLAQSWARKRTAAVERSIIIVVEPPAPCCATSPPIERGSGPVFAHAVVQRFEVDLQACRPCIVMGATSGWAGGRFSIPPERRMASLCCRADRAARPVPWGSKQCAVCESPKRNAMASTGESIARSFQRTVSRYYAISPSAVIRERLPPQARPLPSPTQRVAVPVPSGWHCARCACCHAGYTYPRLPSG